jgi:glycosyltransferase involved in cell wall biosynthesis
LVVAMTQPAAKIVVDVDVLASDVKTGVYYYVQRLLSAVLRVDKANDYTLVHFTGPDDHPDLGLPTENATVKKVTRFPRNLYKLLLRTPLALPFDAVTGARGDLFVFTKFVRYPLLRRRKSLVFIYDTAFVDRPDVIETWHFLRYLRWAVPRTVKRADHVVAISEATRQSLIKHCAGDEKKISVVTPAIDHSVFKPASDAEIETVKAKYGIDKPYVLTVGTLEPRKNLISVLRAFAMLPQELNDRYALVLTGGKGKLDANIGELYDELSKRMTIIRTGYVPTEDLPVLYSGSSVFASPALYEGFGIPVLEAMACSAPVITADNSAMPEVVGDAGVLVDALDVPGLAREMEDLLVHPERADELRKLGVERALSFTWERSAQELIDVMNSLR